MMMATQKAATEPIIRMTMASERKSAPPTKPPLARKKTARPAGTMADSIEMIKIVSRIPGEAGHCFSIDPEVLLVETGLLCDAVQVLVSPRNSQIYRHFERGL